MFGWLLNLVERHRAPMLEAEAFVYRHDLSALQNAASIAADPNASLDERRHCARVLQMAIERQALSDRLDTGTRYDLINDWWNRRGSFIR